MTGTGDAKASSDLSSSNLSGRQRRFLRVRGHHLSPVVQIGREGLSERLVAQAEEQLGAHELIKVKVAEGAPADRFACAEALASATHSELAQVLGRTFLLFKKRQKDSKIDLPEK
jgi:RNA-binding protein